MEFEKKSITKYWIYRLYLHRNSSNWFKKNCVKAGKQIVCNSKFICVFQKAAAYYRLPLSGSGRGRPKSSLAVTLYMNNIDNSVEEFIIWEYVYSRWEGDHNENIEILPTHHRISVCDPGINLSSGSAPGNEPLFHFHHANRGIQLITKPPLQKERHFDQWENT